MVTASRGAVSLLLQTHVCCRVCTFPRRPTSEGDGVCEAMEGTDAKHAVGFSVFLFRRLNGTHSGPFGVGSRPMTHWKEPASLQLRPPLPFR